MPSTKSILHKMAVDRTDDTCTCDLTVDQDKNDQPSAAITTGAGEIILIVHLRYCDGAANVDFSDEMSEAFLSQQQADVFTLNHCGEDPF